MFLALAIQVTNNNQSVNKRVAAEMTWKSKEATPVASLFSEANFLRLVENVVWKGGEIVERLAHQFVRHSRLLDLCYCFGGR